MEFDAHTQIENITKFIRDYYSAHHLSGAVVGLSGGKDSAVVLALFVHALGKENVVALTLPCHSGQEDRTLAERVAKHFGVSCINANLSDTFDKLTNSIKQGSNFDAGSFAASEINLKPRLRMATLYYYAALLTSERKKPYIVAGTSNKCELYVGYFTKGGDNVCDISVLADFSVSEVIKLGEALNVPPEVLHRTPSDGISGKSDEENLKVTYAEIEEYLSDKTLVSESARARIEQLHASSAHKFNVPTYRREK